MIDKGLTVEIQKNISITFRNKNVGCFRADLIVNKKVLIEVKAVKGLESIHESQVINYLNATGIQVGLLINFATAKLTFKRFVRKQ